MDCWQQPKPSSDEQNSGRTVIGASFLLQIRDTMLASKGRHSFQSVGQYKFEADVGGFVTFSNELAEGVIHVDAVQVIRD